MVTLFVNDLDQMTILEFFMMLHNVPYKKVVDDGRYGLKPPYIKVYEVPLDEKRAYKWIKEYAANE